MSHAVVIVAGGRGTRLGGVDGPKQYQDIAGKSLLQRTIDCFAGESVIKGIQVVIHPDDRDLYERSIAKDSKLLDPVTGGNTRQKSCFSGIQAVAEQGFEKVLVHDAARPFVTPMLIEYVVAGIKPGTCALPAYKVSETVKKVTADGLVSETIDRDHLFLAQTPQGFVVEDILAAHTSANAEGLDQFTDDAAVAEWYGMQVAIVPGDRDNLKITTSADLQAAVSRMETRMNAASEIRTGTGYDVHTLGPGSSVTLCGIPIPHDRSLVGHSDADAGLHALTDALLGAIGDGDIGSHFPPTDEQWKDAASDQFLAHAGLLVSKAGGRINNLDITLICEAPKIGPYRERMRQRISEILRLDVDRISVKATTHEGIGTLGRQEGIAAFAIATVALSANNRE